MLPHVMNIFATDSNPIIAARNLCDKHINKMIVESAQMLANGFSLERLAQDDVPRNQKGQPRTHGYPKASLHNLDIRNY
jgi:hypothetical protein